MCLFSTVFLLLANLAVGTWNLRWFPSGRAEHRASERVETAATLDAAEIISSNLVHRTGNAIVFLQELRDEKTVSNLVAAVGCGMKLAAVSAFRDYDRRLGWQQTVIISDLPVISSGFSYWKRSRGVLPPRGFTYALLDAGEEGPIFCCCVHLKSNYGAKTEQVRSANSAKREISADQLVALAKKVVTPDGRRCTRFIIAGDFNFDPYSGDFKDEKTLEKLIGAGFTNCFDGVPLSNRGTHVGTGRFPDSTLDFILYRGFPRQSSPPRLSPAHSVSDHRAVWLVL